MPYDVALICKNGHLISSCSHTYPDSNSAYCPQCGSKTISQCPSCEKEIKGHDISEYGYLENYSIPAYCEYCGQPFPWTESAIESAKLLVQEDEQIPEQIKNSIIESLPDIITETPKTSLATVRIKKVIVSAGKFTADAVRQFVIDFGCEFVKKSLGL